MFALHKNLKTLSKWGNESRRESKSIQNLPKKWNKELNGTWNVCLFGQLVSMKTASPDWLFLIGFTPSLRRIDLFREKVQICDSTMISKTWEGRKFTFRLEIYIRKNLWLSTTPNLREPRVYLTSEKPHLIRFRVPVIISFSWSV